MGGVFPGPIGYAAFAGVKFGGYVLAGIALRKYQPTITASAVKIAAARTGLGILLGPPIALALIAMAEHFHWPDDPNAPLWTFYPVLYALRVLIWALLIFLFTRGTTLSANKFWIFALLGALWSCALDLPGFALAIISPGRLVIC